VASAGGLRTFVNVFLIMLIKLRKIVNFGGFRGCVLVSCAVSRGAAVILCSPGSYLAGVLVTAKFQYIASLGKVQYIFILVIESTALY
jgi:hypothetical protein